MPRQDVGMMVERYVKEKSNDALIGEEAEYGDPSEDMTQFDELGGARKKLRNYRNPNLPNEDVE